MSGFGLGLSLIDLHAAVGDRHTRVRRPRSRVEEVGCLVGDSAGVRVRARVRVRLRVRVRVRVEVRVSVRGGEEVGRLVIAR